MSGRNATGGWKLLQRLADSAWFSYSTIFLLQLVVIWGVWHSARLGTGDTSYYFNTALKFAEQGHIDNIVMSPLYTLFYGAVVAAIGDPYTATWLHRAIIVLSAVLLALAVFRRLLPAPVAWSLAAWWAVSPIIYDTLYEVHLVGVLPVLCACLAASSGGPRGRGVALALLVLGGLTVRNEHTAAALIFAAGCFVWEWRSMRDAPSLPAAMGRLLAAYLLPLALVTGLVTVLFANAPSAFPTEEVMDHRHRLNMAQVFAFGYQQRHPEWTKSPWTDSAELVAEHFGTAEPSLAEMIRNNPRALLDHFAWNLRLTPSGLQLLLFSEVSGHLNPDYPVPPMGSKRALIATVLVLAILLIGGARLIRRWSYWWESLLRDRAPAWMVLIAVSLVAPSIILTQRPRPSYLFGLAALLMALTGLCATTLLYGRRADSALPPSRYLSVWPLAALGLLVAMALPPQRYPVGMAPMSHLFPHVERLRPHRALLSQAGESLYSSVYPEVLHNFTCGDACRSMAARLAADKSDLAGFVRANGFTALYIDEALLRELESQPGDARAFVDYLPEPWRVVDFGEGQAGRWRLFHRSKLG